jgi:N-glycosylase/DNA lyase
VDLEAIRCLALPDAREELLRLPGVGRKIANCVLLFAYGYQGAFPIDVWVMKALRQLYFPKRRPTAQRILRFTTEYFGPNAGYAQQYLFHYMRTRKPAGTIDLSSKKRENFTT